MHYRPFRNDDPPALAELWRSLPPLRARAQTVTAATLDRLIFSKPYFDRNGLIVAEEQGRVVGVVHAAFGADPEIQTLDHSVGVIASLLVGRHAERDRLAAELLEHAEQYLRDAGARQALGSGASPHHPFYLGLYGGAQLPGIVVGDKTTRMWLEQAGYQLQGKRLILHRSLSGFRPPVDRWQMQTRRNFQFQLVEDPPSNSWWEACTTGVLDRVRFMLTRRSGPEVVGRLDVWDMEPLASSWGVHAHGVLAWQVAVPENREAVATFLLGESMRQLTSRGVSFVELQLDDKAEDDLAICRRLGFQEVDEGLILQKTLT